VAEVVDRTADKGRRWDVMPPCRARVRHRGLGLLWRVHQAEARLEPGWANDRRAFLQVLGQREWMALNVGRSGLVLITVGSRPLLGGWPFIAAMASLGDDRCPGPPRLGRCRSFEWTS